MTTYVVDATASTVFKRLEHAHRTHLPSRSFAVIRVDGKGFSKYTRKLVRPFDAKFSADMQATALLLTENVQGAVAAYTQSDEISVVLSDLSSPDAQAWFGGQVQKVVSIAAALVTATATFNSLRPKAGGLAVFDARTPLDGEEQVAGYLRWRQDDAMKNSVGMLASHHFSHRQLQGVSVERRSACSSRRTGSPGTSSPSTCARGPSSAASGAGSRSRTGTGALGRSTPSTSGDANGPRPGRPCSATGRPPHSSEPGQSQPRGHRLVGAQAAGYRRRGHRRATSPFNGNPVAAHVTHRPQFGCGRDRPFLAMTRGLCL
jgi:tRNA(His) 5'-end guanylyltransferase